MSAAVAKLPANANARATAAQPSRELLERQAFEAFKAFLVACQKVIHCDPAAQPARALAEPSTDAAPTDPASDVMTVAQAAAFLGVNRNTVYEFAARGVIPHQKMGKRIILRRGGLVAWLDKSLCESGPAAEKQ